MDNRYSISSRVRIARNIKGFPFTDRINEADMASVCDIVKGALGNEYSYINFATLSPLKKRAYVEQHIVSPEFANAKNKTALFINLDRSVAVMVGEEDHIRIQAFAEGLDLAKALKYAEETEDVIARAVGFMFDEKIGYITKCPTNIGTGLRASVMMFLPATVNSDTVSAISSDLARNGMTIRGVYGEGSSSFGSLYQISNNVTLGLSEEEIVERVTKIAENLAVAEEKNENRLCASNPDYYRDDCMRALGILRSAYMISSSEAGTLISKVMLGANMGYVDIDNKNNRIYRALESVFPATLTETAEKTPSNDRERDIARAESLRKSLA